MWERRLQRKSEKRVKRLTPLLRGVNPRTGERSAQMEVEEEEKKKISERSRKLSGLIEGYGYS